MSLLINQGVHEVDELLIADEALAQITNVQHHATKDGFLMVTLRIMEPAHYAGKTVPFDAPYQADHPVAFLYRNLRKAAGVPYQEGEPVQIDIGTMLMNKAIRIKLAAREYEGTDYQDVKVLGAPRTQAVSTPQPMNVPPVPGGGYNNNPPFTGTPVQPAYGTPQPPVQPAPSAPAAPQPPTYSTAGAPSGYAPQPSAPVQPAPPVQPPAAPAWGGATPAQPAPSAPVNAAPTYGAPTPPPAPAAPAAPVGGTVNAAPQQPQQPQQPAPNPPTFTEDDLPF